MGYPGFPGQGSIYDPSILQLPELRDIVQPDSPRGSYPGSGDPNETYEECQARQDPNVMHIADPCRGKPSGGFKFPEFPHSPPSTGEYDPRRSFPPFAPPGSVPQPGSVRVPPAGFPMAGFPSYRLGDKIQRGDYKGAAGVLVGGVLGSVLGNIISGRDPFDFGGRGMEDEASVDSFRRFKPESGEFLPFGTSEEAKPIPLAVEPYQETLEQNQEVMGAKAQVFPRFANPGDGTLNNVEMANLDPTGELLLRSLRKGEIGPLTDPNIQKAIKDLEREKYGGGRVDSMEGALLAGSPSFDLSYPRISGKNLEGVPNANDPVMKQKLRNRLLKNPAGTEMLPGFLGKA